MQRSPRKRHTPHRPLLLFAALVLLVLAAAALFVGCLFQPVMAARGTMVFLPGL